MSNSTQPSSPQSLPSSRKRMAIRIVALLILFAIVVEAGPNRAWLAHTKLKVSPLLRRIGLWQGEWTLFAPNPIIHNAWLSAEVYSPDGELSTWNSPYWANSSSWERFRRFRYINYYIRMQTENKLVADDMADYLARKLIAPTARPLVSESLRETEPLPAGASEVWKLSLYRNQMNLSLPADGTLPGRDEELWFASSTNLTDREYVP